MRLAVVDDERPAGRRHGRRRQRREAPGGRPHTSPPLLPDRVERPPQRLREPPGQPLHPPRLEVDAARLDRLDREARLLEPPQHGLPGLLHPGRILLDELEPRAGGERLGEPHPRPHSRLVGGAGAGPEERPRPGHRRERDRLPLSSGRRSERSPEGEARNRETGDHGNVCSTRTHVLLSSIRGGGYGWGVVLLEEGRLLGVKGGGFSPLPIFYEKGGHRRPPPPSPPEPPPSPP